MKYAWGSWRIILLLVLFGVLFLAWAFVQIRQGDKATVPPRIIKQRSMASGLWFMFCVFSSFFIVTYYVPIWFQAVRNDSAYHSGLNYLATSAAMSITVISAGFLVGWPVSESIRYANIELADEPYRVLCASDDCRGCTHVGRDRARLYIRC